MSSQALLDAIEKAGKAQLAQLEQETSERVEEILAEAKETAESRREAAYREAIRPKAVERARRRHEARMAALKITAATRGQTAEMLLDQVEARLQSLREQPAYQELFRRLVEEAVATLGRNEIADPATSGLPRLIVDGRDEPLAQKTLQALSLEMEIAPDLESWGGVVLQSGDGRIVVNNTLENRLEQLKPHLGTFIS